MTRQGSGLMSDIYAEEMSVLNPANASTSYIMYDDKTTKEVLSSVRQLGNQIGATMLNEVLHIRLKEELTERIQEIKTNMVGRFTIVLPFDEMQSMLMPETLCNIMQIAGGKMGQQYTNYSYKLGEKVTIRLSCRGGKAMPTILFPNDELTIFSEDFLDLVRPLYLINKSWTDVQLAFEAICKIVQDTRELNFYVPWLRLIIPQEKDLTNEFNAAYRVSNWLRLDREKNATIAMVTRQVRYILNNEHTSKRTWMPSELVQMVRQGEELVTQFNIMKSISVPDIYLREDTVSIEVIINAKEHPTIKWATEAHTHRTMREVERLKELDDKRHLDAIRGRK